MPHVALIDPNAPLAGQLAATLVYPLRGAALYTIAGLALAHFVAGLAGILGLLLLVVVWGLTFTYAALCLRRSAEGYAQPPEPTDDDRSNGWAIVEVLLLALLLLIAAHVFAGRGTALVCGIALACILPAAIVPLAFGDSFATALDPVLWVQVAARIGLPYLLLAGALIFGYLVEVGGTALIATLLSPLLAQLLSAFVATWAIVACFHLMGVIVYRRHEALGLEPEAPKLAAAGGQGNDEALLTQARALQAAGRGEVALILLRERLDARHAEPAMQLAYRELLRANGRNDELLARADECLAALLQGDDTRHALAVVHECMTIKHDFMPANPEFAGRLAEAAERHGLAQLALTLARGYPNTWPHAPDAPRYGLMAARLIAAQPKRRAEAAVLASKLLAAYPDSAQRAAVSELLAQLKRPAT